MRIGIFLLILALSPALPADDARDRLIVETVLKLDSFRFESASAKVKEAIGRYLVRDAGSEEYYELLERFRIVDQLPVLATLASGEKVNARAARLLVTIGGEVAISKALAGAGEDRPQLLMSLGAVNDPISVAALERLLEGKDLPLARQSAKALTGSPAGQLRLLELAETDSLAAELKSGASLALAASVDPAVRARAAKVLPLPASLGGEALPALAELVKMRGVVEKGKAVYLRACFACHRSGNKGIDFGPALTEIGDKLAREAMYIAIMDPSAAISFGYEGFAVETKSGQKLIGYVASDGDAELAMKVPGGALISIKRPDIKSKEALPVSLMPSALVATMSRDELVNLVEYLTTLKK
ncbi:MAG: c-type cytochrome [Verrucomicrobiales bacterium]